MVKYYICECCIEEEDMSNIVGRAQGIDEAADVLRKALERVLAEFEKTVTNPDKHSVVLQARAALDRTVPKPIPPSLRDMPWRDDPGYW